MLDVREGLRQAPDRPWRIDNLPRPPSVNHIWRNGKNAKTGAPVVYATQRLIEWKNACGYILNPRLVRFDVPVKVTLLMQPPSLRADIDNRIKGPLDLLTSSGALKDDSWPFVVGVEARWEPGIQGLSIIVEPIRQPDARAA